MTIKRYRKQLTLLLADDRAIIRPDDFQQLDARDIGVVAVSSAQEVLVHFEVQIPDMVILNIAKVDEGVELCRKIRTDYQAWDLPIIAVIADCEERSIRAYYEAEASDVLLPPISELALYWRVKNWLKARSTYENLYDNNKCLLLTQSLAQLGYWQWDLCENTFTLSRSLYTLLGISLKRCHQTLDEFLDYVHPDDVDEVAEQLTQASNGFTPFEIEHRVIARDQTIYVVHQSVTPVKFGRQVKLLGVVQNITERKRDQDMIVSLSLYDNLTGLPNHEFLKQHLHYIVEHCRRYNKVMAVLSIGIDQFSRVHTSFGGLQRSNALALVGDRLSRTLRRSDFISCALPTQMSKAHAMEEVVIGRIYGDTFHIILPEVLSSVDAVRVVTRLQSALALPFTLEDKSVLLSISAGIALYPENGSCAAELMDNADVAQEQAKLSGQNHYTFYSSDLNKTATDRLALEEDLRYALEAKEFELYYQPKMDIRNQTAVGVEALLRWNSPARGFVSPMEFIPLCEQMGIIKPLGEWVLESACQQAKAWHSEMPELKVSVNVSSLQLDKDFIDTVKAVIAKSGLDPKCLDLEITEGIFLENKCMVSELFSELRSMGITISIDDFGTGYSSLSYLRDLPIDTLKIDRSFLMNIEEDDTSKAIVNSIITLANGLHLNTVAEGVEDVALLNFLIQGGCREVQGYLFSPPLPPEALSQWVLDVEAWRCHFSFT